MKLSQLLENIEGVYQRAGDAEITGICHDSRSVRPGDLFVCIKGALFDPHEHVDDIVRKGAAAIVAEREIDGPAGIPVFIAAHGRDASAHIAAAWYGHPARRMTMIGITGSKGKTTTAYFLRAMLTAAGRRVGMIGTNGVFIGGTVIETPNTTPDPMDFQGYLAEMVRIGCTEAVIECSSQGIMQSRVAGVDFDYGVFTNISDSDHVGPPEHKDFAEYIFYKSRLIANARVSFVNADDEHTGELLALAGRTAHTFGFGENAELRATGLTQTMKTGAPGTEFHCEGSVTGDFFVNMPGGFNVYNALAAISVAHALGVSQQAMQTALESTFIKGRIEMVYRSDALSVCVDYSHNGYSMKNLLTALREYHPRRLVSVFGADGYRVHKRRYEMGEVSGRYADFSIITAGQNRWEKFEDILAEILEGIRKTGAPYIVIPDRKQAVRYAIEHAEPGDLIALIGLGGKKHYEEKGVMYDYREDVYAKSVLRELGYPVEE